jgi:hypothetical protein
MQLLGKMGKGGNFEKSRNAFGTAHRSGERLLLCDSLEHCVVVEVVEIWEKRERWEILEIG